MRNYWAVALKQERVARRNDFIGVAPLVGGSVFLYLMMYLLVPSSFAVTTVLLDDVTKIQQGGLDLMFFLYLGDMMVKVVQSIFVYDFGLMSVIFLVLVLCMSLHMNLSQADLKGSLQGNPLRNPVGIGLVDGKIGCSYSYLRNHKAHSLLTVISCILPLSWQTAFRQPPHELPRSPAFMAALPAILLPRQQSAWHDIHQQVTAVNILQQICYRGVKHNKILQLLIRCFSDNL